MKKSFLLFSSIAVSLLLIFVSCTKESVSTSNPYITEIAPDYTDTPYLGTNNVVDTPYLKIYQVPSSFVDTPYVKKNGK